VPGCLATQRSPDDRGEKKKTRTIALISTTAIGAKRPFIRKQLARRILNRRGAPPCSSDDFDDAHHALVFMIDCMTMVDKPTDDYRISERDDDLEHARPLVCCRRY
jgi:hypothetical protein